jgi:hypothetical protein
MLMDDCIGLHPVFAPGFMRPSGLVSVGQRTRQASSRQGLNVVGNGCTTRRQNAHRTEERETGTFKGPDFSYDKERDIYICPGGKTLTTTGRMSDGKSLYDILPHIPRSLCKRPKPHPVIVISKRNHSTHGKPPKPICQGESHRLVTVQHLYESVIAQAGIR